MDSDNVDPHFNMDHSPVMVQAATCPHCLHTIFSRAHHDMHSCACGGISIDGGFSYVRMAWRTELVGQEPPMTRPIQVQATRRELYEDWNKRYDRWGVFPPDCILVEG